MSITTCMLLIALFGAVVGAVVVIIVHKFITSYAVSMLCFVLDNLCTDKCINTDEQNILVSKYIAEVYPELRDDEDLAGLVSDYVERVHEVADAVRQQLRE